MPQLPQRTTLNLISDSHPDNAGVTIDRFPQLRGVIHNAAHVPHIRPQTNPASAAPAHVCPHGTDPEIRPCSPQTSGNAPHKKPDRFRLWRWCFGVQRPSRRPVDYRHDCHFQDCLNRRGSRRSPRATLPLPYDTRAVTQSVTCRTANSPQVPIGASTRSEHPFPATSPVGVQDTQRSNIAIQGCLRE